MSSGHVADISAYQHKFRATNNNVKQDSAGKVRKRNRAVVSCMQCRSRKSKCDREQPCATCKGHGTACTYSKQNSAKGLPKASPQERLNHLETLLLEMMQSKESSSRAQIPVRRTPSQVATPGESVSSNDTNDYSLEITETQPGAYRATETEESYVGPTHWQAILETVCIEPLRKGDAVHAYVL